MTTREMELARLRERIRELRKSKRIEEAEEAEDQYRALITPTAREIARSTPAYIAWRWRWRRS